MALDLLSTLPNHISYIIIIPSSLNKLHYHVLNLLVPNISNYFQILMSTRTYSLQLYMPSKAYYLQILMTNKAYCLPILPPTLNHHCMFFQFLSGPYLLYWHLLYYHSTWIFLHDQTYEYNMFGPFFYSLNLHLMWLTSSFLSLQHLQLLFFSSSSLLIGIGIPFFVTWTIFELPQVHSLFLILEHL